MDKKKELIDDIIETVLMLMIPLIFEIFAIAGGVVMIQERRIVDGILWITTGVGPMIASIWASVDLLVDKYR